MALTQWTRAELTARVFAMLGEQNSADNELLLEASVTAALEIAEQQFARDALCFRRTATLLAVDEQAVYVQPEDLFHIIDILWDDDETPLVEYKEGRMRRNSALFRSYDAGTPSHWIRETATKFRLIVPGAADDGDETITLYGHYAPLSIGGVISTIARVTNVVTITTSVAHKLRVGDSVTVSGCTTTGLNGDYTVASLTSATAFTAADTGSAEDDEDGYVYYTDGALPMLSSSDVADLPIPYRIALAHYAVFWLSQNHLIETPTAQAAGQSSLVQYENLIAKYCEEAI